MIRVSVMAWLVISAFVAGLLLLPRPLNFLLWIPYGIALPLAIRWCNARQLRIRSEEAAAPRPATLQP